MHQPHRRHVLAVAPVLVTAIACSACSSSSGSATTGPSSAAPPASSSASSSAPAGGGGNGAAAKTMTVSMTEFHIALASRSVSAGTYTLDVKNAGKITHALTVDGAGVDDRSTGDLQPGQSKKLTVTLRTGSYEVFCPVGNHKMMGMDETVQVS